MIRSLECQIVDTWEHGLVVKTGVMTMELYMAHHQSMSLMEDNLVDPEAVIDIPVILEIIQDPSSVRIEMVGFADEGARHLYRALREVKGIGRKSALAALESGTYLDTLRAVAGSDRAFLQSLPDIGPAKASAIIQQLSRYYGRSLPQPLSVPLKNWIEAREDIMSSMDLTLEEAEERLLQELGKD